MRIMCFATQAALLPVICDVNVASSALNQDSLRMFGMWSNIWQLRSKSFCHMQHFYQSD